VSPRRGSRPLALILAEGDLAAAWASLIVVGRFNGLAPTGAEAAVDAALGGAIRRRAAAGALDGQFGSAHFLPATHAQLAADAVLVLNLGEPSKLDVRRLPELGAAIVDALATMGAGHAATGVHGAGVAGVSPGQATRMLVEGFARAVAELSDVHEVVQLTVVEPKHARISGLRRALGQATMPRSIDRIIERNTAQLGSAGRSRGLSGTETPDHVRVAVSCTSGELKVALVSDEACDAADYGAYPRERRVAILDLLKEGILTETSGVRRLRAMKKLGRLLYEDFFAWPKFDLTPQLRQARGGYLVLRLDESTVDMPWELLLLGDRYISRSHVLARQREIVAPGHAAAFVPPHAQLRALVIGNPTSGDPDRDLPGAAAEAESVAAALTATGAEVRTLVGRADQKEVLDLLDTFNPDLLHYAGHASFDPLNQAQGGLELTDGALTSATLAAQPKLPRLFFANGCSSAQTGDVLDQMMEKAAATRDLAGGILRAGARAFIGSQWAVDDDAAATFARAFYAALAKGRGGAPTPIGEAVRSARQETIRGHGRAEPAWAGYSLYGSPWASAL
jgi:hypothetical protein